MILKKDKSTITAWKIPAIKTVTASDVKKIVVSSACSDYYGDCLRAFMR